MVVVVADDHGQPAVWLDPAGRHDVRSGVDILSPLSDVEGLAVLVDQLDAGIAAFTAAHDQAQADITPAKTAQAAATNVQIQAQAFVAAAAYQAAQLNMIAVGLRILAGQVAALQGWRQAVDDNAARTDNALIWLAQLAKRQLA